MHRLLKISGTTCWTSDEAPAAVSCLMFKFTNGVSSPHPSAYGTHLPCQLTDIKLEDAALRRLYFTMATEVAPKQRLVGVTATGSAVRYPLPG
jgi:hypothetical protein